MRPIDADSLISKVNFAMELASNILGGTVAKEIYTPFIEQIELESTIEQPTWIPVSERLPKSRIAVLGALLWDTIDIVWYDKDDGVWQSEFVNAYAEGEVTHWMPLPQPPKGDE